MSNSPEAKFRIGYVVATVWKNQSADRIFYSVELSRTYKDDGDLKNTSALGHADIMNGIKVLQRAEAYIADQL